MGTVKSIEDAVQALPRSELAEFRSWFAEFDAIAWDQQLESDAALQPWFQNLQKQLGFRVD